MKLNKKGSIGIGAAFLVFIVTIAFLLVMYSSSLNNLIISGKTTEMNQHYVNAANGKERLHGALYENFSLVGEIKYTDILETPYVISTVSQNFLRKTLTSTGNPVSFELKNKSDISVDISVTPHTFESICNYSASLLSSTGKELLQNSELNHSNKTFVVQGEMLYNEQTGETNLGDFTFSANSSGCYVDAIISYDELTEREISVKGNSLDSNIIIQGLPNEKITIKGGN